MPQHSKDLSIFSLSRSYLGSFGPQEVRRAALSPYRERIDILSKSILARKIIFRQEKRLLIIPKRECHTHNILDNQ